MKMKKVVFTMMSLAAALMASAGEVKFAKTAVTVKEDAAYAELTVKRTGVDLTRVRFATVADTAVPGSEYYATNGILSWAQGDKKDQKIRIRLMPDLVAKWEPEKSFGVRLEALDASELAPEEEAATVLTDTAVVTIRESAKQAPGKVAVTGCLDADYAWTELSGSRPTVAFQKNGWFDTTAIRIERQGGSDGAIRVKVAAVNGTAKAGVDYTLGEDPETVVREVFLDWADGETEAKELAIASIEDDFETVDCTPVKKFTLKLTAVTGDGRLKPSVGTSTVNVSLENGRVFRTVADLSKALTGTGVKVSGSTWYQGDEATLLSKPMMAGKSATVTYTVTGPGLFMADAWLEDGTGRLFYQVGGGKQQEAVEDYVTVENLAAKGSKSYKFTMKGLTDVDPAVGATGSSYAEDVPCFWIPFGGVKPDVPADKSVVSGAASLSWIMPEAVDYVQASDMLHYRVTVAESKTALKKEPLFSGETDTPSVAVTNVAFEAGKTYYWRVDYLYGEGETLQEVTGSSVWSFTVAEANAGSVYVAEGADVRGRPIGPGSVVELHQGVQTSFALAASNVASAVTFSVGGGKLPDGLKLAQDKKTKAWSVTGTPTKAGDYDVVIAGKVGKASCNSVSLRFHVKAIGLAAGNFAALFTEDGGVLENAACALGKVDFSVTEKGKLSAKVAVGGKTYSFSGTGFTGIACGDEGVGELDPGAPDTLTVTLQNVVKSGKAAYTNLLELTVVDAVVSNLYALGAAAGEARLSLYVPTADGKSVETGVAGEGVVYCGALYRDNADEDLPLSVLQKYEGYYTSALVPPDGLDEGLPRGSGYLTATVDKKGRVKVAGMLADGTKVSFSTDAYLTGDLTDDAGAKAYRLIALPFTAKKTMCFGGELALERLVEDEIVGGTLFDADAALTWNQADAFELALNPVGGYYDTVSNLQTYYRDRETALEFEGLEDVSGSVAVTFAGNTPTVDKASGVKVTLKRATGVFSGSVGSSKYNGILLSSRPADVLDERVLGLGSLLVPTTVEKKKVKVSHAIGLVGDLFDPDFGAGDIGEWAGEEIPQLEE